MESVQNNYLIINRLETHYTYTVFLKSVHLTYFRHPFFCINPSKKSLTGFNERLFVRMMHLEHI
jgi:hypothetical protein